MIGYGPPADPGRLPTPGDEDHQRRAAEEYPKRRRARRRMAWIALIVVAAVVVIVLVAHPWHHGTLTYRFEPINGGAVIIATDNRSGSHTVTFVVRDLQGKVAAQMTVFNDGNGGSGSEEIPSFARGTYTYVV